MRTAKLKLMAAVSAAVVGLAGTGTIVAVGQEKKPAEAGKTDPTPKVEAGKLDLKGEKNGVAMTSLPDIKPISLDELRAFTAKHVPPVLESDPPLRKLQKAKLRAAMEELSLECQFMQMGNPKVPYETTMTAVQQAAREAVATAVELAGRREDQTAWLEFGVGVHKDIEAFITERVKQGIARPAQALTARRHRLDAEIALLKHAQQREGRPK